MDILEIESQDLLIPIIAFSNQALIRVQSSQNVINFNQLLNCRLNYQNPIIANDKLSIWESKLQACTGYSKEDFLEDFLEDIREDFLRQGTAEAVCRKKKGL